MIGYMPYEVFVTYTNNTKNRFEFETYDEVINFINAVKEQKNIISILAS